jgi:hypothetical protein
MTAWSPPMSPTAASRCAVAAIEDDEAPFRRQE